MAANLIAKTDGPFLDSGSFNARATSAAGNAYFSVSITDSTTTTTAYVEKGTGDDGPNNEVIDGVMLYLEQSSGSPGGTFSVKLMEPVGTDPVREVTVNVADLPANGSPKWTFFKFSSNYTTVDAFTKKTSVKSSVNAAVIVYRSSSVANWARLYRKASTAQVPVSGDTVYIVGELTGAGTGTDRYVTPGVETGITVNVGQRGFHSAPPAPPVVTSVSANSGPAAGSTNVTITGTDFVAATGVTFGGTAATAVVTVNSTTITCTTPAHAAGVVDVVVTNSDTLTGTGTNAYTFVAAPTVTSVSANNGKLAGGTNVTITGTGFLASPSDVTFGGTSATNISRTNSTTITCTTPAHSSGAVNVVVTNSDSQTGTGTGVYTYNALPTVTSVSPDAGTEAGGTSVTITGTGFTVSPSGVTFGGTAATSVSRTNSTTITCLTPAHAQGAVNVGVTNADTQTGTGTAAYTYDDAPVITSLSSTTGVLAGLTAMTITGTGFIAVSGITFGGTAATSIVTVSGTSVTCKIPAHAAGTVDVVLTNADTQTSTLSSSFTYAPAPDPVATRAIGLGLMQRN